ncbi:MAG: hypothetical protein LBD09_01660 [Treponema sp.]|jgi:hypothetical protein|nr:hypothetical protein [Treponema sp.]
MSGGGAPAPFFEGKAGLLLKNLFSRMKDSLLLGGWIGGILLLGGLLWFFTRPFQTQALMNQVNRTLARREEPAGWRLLAPIPRRELGREGKFRGFWYTRSGGDADEAAAGRAVVFTVMGSGVLIPCAAAVSPAGLVEEIFPLTLGGEAGLERLTPGIMEAYIRRIEAGAEP